MNKTKKMQEIEQKFGMDLEELLRQKYEVERNTAGEIGEILSVTDVTIRRWLRDYKIPVRTISEARLNGKKKPGEEQLRQWYEVEKKTSYEIAEIVGVGGCAVGHWLREYKIPVRIGSEAHLKGKKKPSEQQLRRWYETEGKSTVKIGELVGVSNNTISHWLHYYKIPTRSTSEIMLDGKQKPSKEQLRQLYEVEKKSAAEISELVGFSGNTVRRWLCEYKIQIKTESEARLKGKQKPSNEQLRQFYIVEGKTAGEIGEIVGVNTSTVCYWLREYKIPVRTGSEAKLNGKKKPDEQQLKQWYEVDRKSAVEIADQVGVASGTVCYWLREYNIPIRSLSEASLHGKKKPSERQLRNWYEVDKKTSYEIAEIVGVGGCAVLRWLRGYKIPIRNQDNTRLLKKEALEKVIEKYTA